MASPRFFLSAPAALMALLLTLAGCASSPVVQLYDGAERPDNQVLTVRVPTHLEVFTINGSEVDGVNTFFNTDYKDLKLSPGEYEIIAYYKQLWDLNADEHEVMKSDPVKFLVDGEAGEHYQLDYQRPNNPTQAKALEQDFSGWVENMETGEKTDSEPSGMVLRRGILAPLTGSEVQQGGNQVAPRARQAVAPADGADSTDSAGSSDSSDSADATESSDPAPADSADGDYLDTLKAQWRQATQEERREFLRWLSQ